jgi:GTP-binding protein
MQPLFEAIIDNVPPPPVELEGPLQLQVSSLDYNSYVGLMGIGRISRGVVKRNMPVTLVQRDGTQRNAQLMELYGFEGLTRNSIDEAGAGDIVVFSGIEDLKISDTVCARGKPRACRRCK